MSEKVNILKLTLHGHLIAYLAGFQNGRNVLRFTEDFRANQHRPTFSLITHPAFQRAAKLMNEPWTRHQRLHPILSNLLPEGSLRELIAQGLKVHIDHEFDLFSYLGKDLPGALVATPLEPYDVPDSVLVDILGNNYQNTQVVSFDTSSQHHKFSLAGVQMKFSMKEKDGRYNLSKADALGDWIIKMPSTKHKDVPLNEYCAMTLASLVGVDIPDIKLVDLKQLDNLPYLNVPHESQAFAIKRFDRNQDIRIHMEDFAQVFVKYPHEKYNAVNYEQIGRILYEFSGDALSDVQQFAKRLLVNILLANGDAHLKNWSLWYPNQFTPRLSPAYDIVTTRVYINDERHIALNLGKTKDWYAVSYAHFQSWSEKSGIPWRAIKPHLDDVMDKAKTYWRTAINTLPITVIHKQTLITHWKNLHPDFRL